MSNRQGLLLTGVKKRASHPQKARIREERCSTFPHPPGLHESPYKPRRQNCRTHLCYHGTWEAEVPGLHGKALFQNEQKIVVAGVGRKGLNSERDTRDDKILPYCISNFLPVVPKAFKVQLKRESTHSGSQVKVHPDFKAWQESKNVRQPVTSYQQLQRRGDTKCIPAIKSPDLPSRSCHTS